MAKISKPKENKEDPLNLILKELRKYYQGTKRIKPNSHLGDECCKK